MLTMAHELELAAACSLLLGSGCAESVLPTQLDLFIAWARQECLCAVLVDGFQADSSWQLAIAVSAVRSRSTHVVNLLVKFGHY